MSDFGFIKIHRKFKDWVFYHNSEMVHFWIHLMLCATHKDTSDGDGTRLGPGQFSTGRKRLSRETGLSESKIERFLKKLEIEQQIEQQTLNKKRVITILNWREYQISDSQSNNKRTTNEQQTNNKRTQNKNVKNEKNEKNIHDPRRFLGILNSKLGLCEIYVPHIHDPKIKPLLDAFPLDQILTTIDHYGTKRQQIGSFSSKIYNSNDILKNFPQLHAEAMKLKGDMDELKNAGIFDDED